MNTVAPTMKQYSQVKVRYSSHILLMPMDGFYEALGNDAVIVAEVLDLVLTSRIMDDGQRLPLAGIPESSIDASIARLTTEGYPVALCTDITRPADGDTPHLTQIMPEGTPGNMGHEAAGSLATITEQPDTTEQQVATEERAMNTTDPIFTPSQLRRNAKAIAAVIAERGDTLTVADIPALADQLASKYVWEVRREACRLDAVAALTAHLDSVAAPRAMASSATVASAEPSVAISVPDDVEDSASNDADDVPDGVADRDYDVPSLNTVPQRRPAGGDDTLPASERGTVPAGYGAVICDDTIVAVTRHVDISASNDADDDTDTISAKEAQRLADNGVDRYPYYQVSARGVNSSGNPFSCSLLQKRYTTSKGACTTAARRWLATHPADEVTLEITNPWGWVRCEYDRYSGEWIKVWSSDAPAVVTEPDLPTSGPWLVAIRAAAAHEPTSNAAAIVSSDDADTPASLIDIQMVAEEVEVLESELETIDFYVSVGSMDDPDTQRDVRAFFKRLHSRLETISNYTLDYLPTTA